VQTEIWQQIDSLFDEYLDASPEAQTSFFSEKNLAPEIRHELEKLISAVNKTDSFIETPTFTPVKEILAENEDSLLGQKISSYQLEKLIGKGGNGAVYLAKRIDDFSKEVAIKLIPTFSATKSNKDNFRRERQILARLEHENIARILDGGTTKDGTPYLVMEYVDGLPLDDYCRQENLSVNQRLELFLEVCKAVTFAHRNLIVHRDLKPTNILVNRDGKVKLLDFGIAKLLQDETVDFSNSQTFKGNAFTPEYASPEQINGDAITTATDVYSLGVVLYELLTEQRPHSFKDKPLNEILRIISSEEITPPTKNQKSKIKNRNAELDAVTLRALAKNPRRRYQSAKELQDDISNYLNDLPISARPNTTLYRAKKYIYRHKVSLAVAAGILLLTFGWIATVIWQTLQTAAEARENRRSAYSAEMILAANEYENTNLNRVNELLEKYRPENGDEDLRGFEWYFLKNLLSPETKIGSLIHSDEVWHTEFSPDSRFLATVSNDNITRIWDVENKSVVTQTPEQKGAWKCAYYPDGKRFAVSSSSNANPIVTIYKAENAAEIFSLKGHAKRIRAVDVSPDGKIIATGSQDGTVRIWNAETGAELRKFDFATKDKGMEIHDLQFSDSGAKLVVGGFDVLAVFDTKTWQMKRINLNDFAEKNINLYPWKVAFSPLEKTIAFGNWTGEVGFLDADNLKLLRVLPLHQVTVKGLDFSNDGKILATASWDRTAKFVDVQTGEVVNELRGHFSGVHEVVYSPDGTKLATASADFNVNLWNAAKVAKENSLLAKSTIFQISNDTRNFVGWNNGNQEITSWNLAEKNKLWSGKAAINAFTSDISKDDQLIVFGEREGFISLFNYADGTKLKRLQNRPQSIYGIKFSADASQIYALYEDGLFQAIDLETGGVIHSNQLHSSISKTLSVSPDGKFIATGSNDKTVKVLDAQTFKEKYVFDSALKPLYMVTFSADSRLLATAGADDYVRIYRMSDGKLLQELSGMSAGVFSVAFSPDSKRLATSSDIGIVRLWEIESGRQVLAFTAGKKQITQLKFTADAKALISVDVEGKVNFWETK
jgi:eukaryotic-like serine/threonine-protein kinase